jgi:hypothetical protein
MNIQDEDYDIFGDRAGLMQGQDLGLFRKQGLMTHECQKGAMVV